MHILEQLPTEILASIINHVAPSDLYACALVNKNFHVATTPRLWRTIKALRHTHEPRIFTMITEPPYSFERYIRHVDFSDFLTWTDATFLLLMQHLGLLEELVLSNGWRITDASFQQLSHYCPHLTSLSLSRAGRMITDVSFQSLFIHCHNLRSFSLEGASQITHRSMTTMAQHCHQLTKLKLHDCLQLRRSNTVSQLVPPNGCCQLDDLDYRMLHHFDLHHMDNLFDGWEASEAVTVELAPLRHHLTRLTLSSPSIGTLRNMAMMGTPPPPPPLTCYWPHLTDLTLHCCIFVNETEIIRFLQCCHGALKHLSLINGIQPRSHRSSFHDSLLDAISTCQPDLLTLDVTGNPGYPDLTGDGIARFVRNSHRLVLLTIRNPD
ncbi:unnamed protein product [Absidia cylindrospora]